MTVVILPATANRATKFHGRGFPLIRRKHGKTPSLELLFQPP